MPDLNDLRGALLNLAVAAQAVKLANDRDAAARAVVAEMLKPGERLYATLGDWNLGTISRTELKDKAYVDSTRELTKWAEENDPSAFVKVLDQAWVDRVLADATKNGAALVYKDGEPTGETIPGVKIRKSGGTLTVNHSESQREAFELLADEGKVSREGYVLTPGEVQV